MFKKLVYTPSDSSPRFTCKVNLSNTKNPAWFLFWPPFKTEERATRKLAATKDYRGACVS